MTQNRFLESLGANFSTLEGTKKLLFLSSSSDEGVIRNGGKNGARFAPRSFLSAFKHFTTSEVTREYRFQEIEVSDSEAERKDFAAAQLEESKRIEKALNDSKGAMICHIGGGHDHVYPLLKAASRNFKKVVVINLDAHADTRTDDEANSGTPFRQFANEFSGEFKLFQIGLHPYSNAFSTLTNLQHGEMSILWRDELDQASAFFDKIKREVTEQTLVIFSLDADALEGTLVSGVSAINTDGLTQRELRDLYTHYLNLGQTHAPFLGIYELNPVYDHLSALSMRTLATFVYESLK
jgi:formiminoglutamase